MTGIAEISRTPLSPSRAESLSSPQGAAGVAVSSGAAFCAPDAATAQALELYFDYHATTPLEAEVVAAMEPFYRAQFANPHSTNHTAGQAAQGAVEQARAQVGALLGVPASCVLFTGTATEANNLVLRAVMAHQQQKAGRDTLLTVATEHPSVLETARHLAQQGTRVVFMPVEPDGRLSLAELQRHLDERVGLVSVMAANNELGVLAPLEAMAERVHAAGALFHSDMVQLAGRASVTLTESNVDFATLSAHKLYGPKGVGALLWRTPALRPFLSPSLYGGSQENGLRAGTLAPALVVGFGTACQLALRGRDRDELYLHKLTEKLLRCLQSHFPDLQVNGPVDVRDRLAGNLHVTLPGLDAEDWRALMPHIAVSTGAACKTEHARFSHVLAAIGKPPQARELHLRFGLGRPSTEAHVAALSEQLEAMKAFLL